MTETTVIAEQPSPVSVLDATFYREDPPSPINRKSEISKDSGIAHFNYKKCTTHLIFNSIVHPALFLLALTKASKQGV